MEKQIKRQEWLSNKVERKEGSITGEIQRAMTANIPGKEKTKAEKCSYVDLKM